MAARPSATEEPKTECRIEPQIEFELERTLEVNMSRLAIVVSLLALPLASALVELARPSTPRQ
jgi:hypothetical protein